MKLTKNFTLKELTSTSTGLPNNPSHVEIARLKLLCENVLQPLRDKFGKAITVNSGFRSQAVNGAVGGVSTSQHALGEAGDITALSKADNERLFNIIKNELPFDQLIKYGNRFIHVSYTERKPNRRQILYR